ncbi:tRNA (adenosine(37)-N6)-threonylcarbamoyltransferase complex transferase subunit TsaD [Candidatus Parcubacteria bacterium]|nr:tRNA (adenosine(37)-N6)-threonylcarbamoyltransferase complex transferase subunit TsaD [Candidatus Parcubacteria bacterium]
MTILGIETSCDETAAAVARGVETRHGASVEILSNIISSQIEIHKKYGGVVPEVAAREHVLKILPVINEALEEAGVGRRDMINHVPTIAPAIDAIAVATGPGLITSLMIGVETAKTLAYAWNIPIIPINHIEGHIYANFIGANPKHQAPNSKQISNSKFQIPNIEFPAVVLTVSGGHTLLALMKGHGDIKTIGQTRDDAAGEAFDKGAKMLGLGYPGGPAIAAAAAKYQNPKHQILNKSQAPNSNDQNRIILPRPMLNSKNFDFSFSGLKTALLYSLKKDKGWKNKIPEYCCEYQQAIIDVLISKTIKAAKKYKVRTIMLAGGVAANKELRSQMPETIKNKLPDIHFTLPDLKYTTDNAAMMAAAGYFKARHKKFTPWQDLKVDCNLEI